MIEFISHKQINKQKWDACVSGSIDPCLFSYSWYLDAVTEEWGGLVLNDYEAVFPLPHRSKYKIEVVYQPFFTRYYGLSAKGKIQDKMLKEILSAIPAKFRHVEFGLQEGQSAGKQFEVNERKFQLLDLNASYKEISAGYSDNAKRNIKKAIKSGLLIKEGIAPKKVVDLFKSAKGKDLELLKSKNYASLIKLMEICVKNETSLSYAVYDGEHELLCAAFFIKTGKRITYLKSGLTERGKGLGAMHLVMDTVIKRFADSPMCLDFGGSSVESVARFYKNFGGKDCVYLQVKKDELPGLIKWARKIKAGRS